MKENRKQHVRSGFTMVELMAVLIILGLLAALVVGNFVGTTDKGRKIQTLTNLKVLHNAVKQFYMDCGRWPGEDEGLDVLINQPSDVENYQPGGYLDTTEVPTDGWGREFYYERYPESGKPFVIISWGADGQEGGEDFDADLKSTDAN